jgi:hypothetical protein
MARYKNAYRDELDEEIKEEVVVKEPVEPDPEEETFKKRYGDLRRFAQQKQTEYEDRIKTLEEEVSLAKKKPTEFPKSDEEFEAWASKYPDVVANIKTMIMKHSREVEDEFNEKLSRVKELEETINQQELKKQLHKLHPDYFNDILPTTEFIEWVSSQPKNIKDALNGWDVYAASRAIDLYKADMGISKKKDTSEREAAESVSTKGNSSGPSKTSGDYKFTESQVNAMHPREYEKNEDAIMEAIRTGKFKYDLSGAAR